RWLSALMARSRATDETLGARYLGHNLPAEGLAGASCFVRVLVENCGAGRGRRDPPDGHHAGLCVFVDDVLVGCGRADGDVAPGEQAVFAVFLTWPASPGPHRVRLDMMINNRTWFSGAGVPALTVDVRLRPPAPDRTDELVASSQRDHPWFFSPAAGVHRTRTGEPAFPLFAQGARGARVIDVDGREYVDLLMGWGTCVLGHADPRVQRALAESLA